MRLKTIVSSSVPEAMDLMRAALGSEVVIIASQRQADGTICLTGAVRHRVSETALKTALTPQEAPHQNTVIQLLLKRHSVPETVKNRLINRIQQGFQIPTEDMLAAALDEVLTFAAPGGRVQVLLGPPASGKTTVLLKEIVQERLAKRPVAVITLDKRPGAVAELTAFCSLLKVPLFTAENEAEVPFLLHRIPDEMRVYIDTTGRAAVSAADMAALTSLAEKLPGAEALLTVPLGVNTADITALSKHFLVFQKTLLVGTFAHLFYRVGGLLNVAYRLGCPLTALVTDDAATTPLVMMTADTLSQHMRRPLVYRGGALS